MKKQYCSPSAKKIDYTYDDQVAATSPGGNHQGFWNSKHSAQYCQQWIEACEDFFFKTDVPCNSFPNGFTG